jgi:hypothetical protein
MGLTVFKREGQFSDEYAIGAFLDTRLCLRLGRRQIFPWRGKLWIELVRKGC